MNICMSEHKCCLCGNVIPKEFIDQPDDLNTLDEIKLAIINTNNYYEKIQQYNTPDIKYYVNRSNKKYLIDPKLISVVNDQVLECHIHRQLQILANDKIIEHNSFSNLDLENKIYKLYLHRKECEIRHYNELNDSHKLMFKNNSFDNIFELVKHEYNFKIKKLYEKYNSLLTMIN